MTGEWLGSFMVSTIRSATPLIFCALAVLLAERVGIWYLSVEGVALAGALAAIMGEVYGGNPWVGVLVTIIVGALLGLASGRLMVHLPTDQTSIGIAFNLTMLGLTSFIFRLGGKEVQVIVPGMAGNFYGLTPFAVLAIVLTAAIYWFLHSTAPGLKIRSVGENAHAAEAAGTNVVSVRVIVMIIAGILAALGGAALTSGWVRTFADNITVGRGFIGMAAVYLGRWNPILAFCAALIFGAGEALAYRAQAGSFSGNNAFYLLMIPYILTLLAVAITGQARGPADAGKPYIRR